jgi:hypothetical protein
MKLLISAVLAILLLTGNSRVAHAQEQGDVHPYLTHEFFVDVGVFYPDRKVTLRADGLVSGPSDSIEFTSEFGLKKSDETFALNFGWRFGEKWELGGQYFKSGGDRGKVLDEDVEWNDIIFEQGTGIAAGQNFSLIRIFFARRFESSSDQHEFGVGAGFHWLEISGYIEGDLIIGGGGTEFRRESVEAKAPLPNLGVWYMYSISPKLALKARFDWLDVSFDIYDGTLVNASAGLNYQAFEHVGIGVNYNIFDLDVGINKSDWRGNAELSYEGVFAYLSFYW